MAPPRRPPTLLMPAYSITSNPGSGPRNFSSDPKTQTPDSPHPQPPANQWLLMPVTLTFTKDSRHPPRPPKSSHLPHKTTIMGHLTIALLCITIIAPKPVLLRSACSDPPQVIRVARGQKVTIDYWIGSEDHQLEEKLDGKNSPPKYETTSPADLSLFTTYENSATPVYDPKNELHTYLQELITEISTSTPEPTEDLSGKSELGTQNYQLDGITESGDSYFIYLPTESAQVTDNPATDSPTGEDLSEKSYFGSSNAEPTENQSSVDLDNDDDDQDIVDTTATFLSGRQDETESSREGTFFSTVSKAISTLSPFRDNIQTEADIKSDVEVVDTTVTYLDGRHEDTESSNGESFFSTLSQLITTLSPFGTDTREDATEGNSEIVDGRADINSNGSTSNEIPLHERSEIVQGNLSERSSNSDSNITEAGEEVYVLFEEQIMGRSNETESDLLTDKSDIEGLVATNSSSDQSNKSEQGEVRESKKEENATLVQVKSLNEDLSLDASSQYSQESFITEENNLTVLSAKSHEEHYNTLSEPSYILDETNITGPEAKSYDENFNISSEYKTESYSNEAINVTSHVPKSLEESTNSSSEYHSEPHLFEETNSTFHTAKSFDEGLNSSSEYKPDPHIIEETNSTSHVAKSLDEGVNSTDYKPESPVLEENNVTLHLSKSLEDLNSSSEYLQEPYIFPLENITAHVAKSLEESLNSSYEYLFEPHTFESSNATDHEAKSLESTSSEANSTEHVPRSLDEQPDTTSEPYILLEETNDTAHIPKSIESLHSTSAEANETEHEPKSFEGLDTTSSQANATEHEPKSVDEQHETTFAPFVLLEETNDTVHIPKSLEEGFNNSSELLPESYIIVEENSTASSRHDLSTRAEDAVLINEETIISTKFLPKEDSTSQFSPTEATETSVTESQRPQFRQPVPIFIRLYDSGRSLDKALNGPSRVRFQHSPTSFIPTFRSNNNRVVLRMLRQRPHATRRNLRTKRSTTNENVTSCEWLFKSEPGVPMLLTFRNFSTPQNPDCLKHYIAVERESNGFESRWCGPTADRPGHAAFARSEIRIRLYSEGQLNIPAGFSVEVQALDLKLLRKYAEVRRLIKNN